MPKVKIEVLEMVDQNLIYLETLANQLEMSENEKKHLRKFTRAYRQLIRSKEIKVSNL